MHDKLAIACVDTPLGELGLAAGEHGLIRLRMGGPVTADMPSLMKRRRDNGRGRRHPWEVLEQACHELAEYLLSARESFETPLDLSGGTEFQRSVWRRLQRLKFGSSVSYARLSEMLGRPDATRAVAGAVGANPLPIFVPCHRVLAADKKLGGFSGGLARKRKLLTIEGIRYHLP